MPLAHCPFYFVICSRNQQKLIFLDCAAQQPANTNIFAWTNHSPSKEELITSTKKTWMSLNALFVANYTLHIVFYLVRVPLYPLPNFINVLCLASSSAISLLPFVSSVSEILSQHLLHHGVLTFPHEILLLLPFYLLSIYHLSWFVLSNKKIFERTNTYAICMALSTHHVGLGKLALLTEILAVPLSFLMIFFRASRIVTFTALAAIVRQQYFNNPAMRSVFGEMRVSMDGSSTSQKMYRNITAREGLPGCKSFGQKAKLKVIEIPKPLDKLFLQKNAEKNLQRPSIDDLLVLHLLHLRIHPIHVDP